MSRLEQEFSCDIYDYTEAAKDYGDLAIQVELPAVIMPFSLSLSMRSTSFALTTV